MLNICLTKQRKNNTSLVVYDGSEIHPYVDGIANKVIAFNQFHEYCTHGYWMADNISEQLFEDLYNSGQRMFWLTNDHETIVLTIKEWETTSDHDIEFKEDKSLLFEDLIIQAQNYLDKILNDAEFSKVIHLAQEFLITRDKVKFIKGFLDIEDAAYERLNQRIGE